MLRILTFAGVALGIAALVPALHESGLFASGPRMQAEPAATVAARAGEGPASGEALSGRRVRLDADASGHFSAGFRLNGRSVDAMVDTGATVVAINRSTARRIGISLTAADFTGVVRTANGEARAAAAVIDRLEIGRIEVRGVRAVVLEDKALSNTLIGMSFLSQLRRFQVENGALVMEQ